MEPSEPRARSTNFRDFQAYVQSLFPAMSSEQAETVCAEIVHFDDRIPEAAKDLRGSYDICVALAMDGLGFGFVFHEHGWPTKVVRLHRKGSGATYDEITPISRQDIAGKRVVLLDNDMCTGRTMSRAVRELQAHKPECIDALLWAPITLMSVQNWKKWRQWGGKIALKPGMRCTETPEGLEIYLPEGKTVIKKNRDAIAVDTTPCAPSSLRKVLDMRCGAYNYKGNTEY